LSDPKAGGKDRGEMIVYWLIKRFRRWREERRAQQVTEASETTPPRSARPRPPARAAPLDADAAISVRGLRKEYADQEAVRGIDFDVRRGEIVACLGPNGAGKTTTVEILEGYRERSAGEIRVLGEDPAAATRGWRDRIGVVLQESEPEPYLTARQCLELYAGYYARPRPIDETLELVGLQAKADAAAGTLSGGQRRRLDVALALIGDPELVFLDEPTTGFDPSARRAAWQAVAGLRELGKTIFLTTHYMDEAEFLADRIFVLAAGEIVAEGTPETLGGRDRSAARISFTLPPHVDAAQIPPRFAEAAHRNGRVAVRSTAPVDDLRSLTLWASERGLDLPDLEVRRPTLEDIYLELTGTASA
jgi:ABC-2 type transport system ATP-binding protein